jgi:hypothetical protein
LGDEARFREEEEGLAKDAVGFDGSPLCDVSSRLLNEERGVTYAHDEKYACEDGGGHGVQHNQ